MFETVAVFGVVALYYTHAQLHEAIEETSPEKKRQQLNTIENNLKLTIAALVAVSLIGVVAYFLG